MSNERKTLICASVKKPSSAQVSVQQYCPPVISLIQPPQNMHCSFRIKFRSGVGRSYPACVTTITKWRLRSIRTISTVMPSTATQVITATQRYRQNLASLIKWMISTAFTDNTQQATVHRKPLRYLVNLKTQGCTALSPTPA